MKWVLIKTETDGALTKKYYQLTSINMKKETRETTLRYAKSIALTFLAGFAIEVVPLLGSLTLEGLKDGTLDGLIFVGVRTGFKMVLEAFLVAWYAKKTVDK